MRRRDVLFLATSILAVPAALGVSLHGCSDDGGDPPLAGIVQITSATAASLPKGPDAIGGIGGQFGPVEGDFLLTNQRIQAVVDLPATDPSSLGGAFPLSNVLAPTGGTLIDLATLGANNDQWNQMGQGVVGIVTVIPDGTNGQVNASGPVFIDGARDFVAAGVQAGDTLTLTNGLNAGRNFRIGLVAPDVTGDGVGDPFALGLFQPPGAAIDSDSGVTYVITSRTSPLENIIAYDSATIVNPVGDPAVLRVTGGIVSQGRVIDGTLIDLTTGRVTAGATPLEVQTDYILFRDTDYLIVETRILNPGAAPIGLTQVADVIIIGGTSIANLLPWTPLSGFQARGLGSPLIVPFASFRGRDEPPASYSVVDALAGQLIHASDGNTVAVNIQLSSAADLSPNETLRWSRRVVVGSQNDVASSADEAIALLANAPARVNPDTGQTLPNPFAGLAQISGTVFNAPPGTTITALQVEPALVFDPGLPSGLAARAGFFSSTLYGAPELLITQGRPDPRNGDFTFFVPQRFGGLGAGAIPLGDLDVPAGLERGSDPATYRILVEAPGHDPQTVLIDLAKNPVNNLVFDLSGETGTIELVVTDGNGDPTPATVVIRGMDPDGFGPAPTTADPTFGGPDIAHVTTSAPLVEARAEGAGNVVHLLDGRGSVQVAPGAYQVLATRGLEYSAARFPPVGSATDFFLIGAGQTVRTETAGGTGPIGMVIDRVLDDGALPDPGGTTFESPLRRLIAADFHVHSGYSFDSFVPRRDRVISYLTAGVEMLVATEHDNLVDFAPVLADLARENPTLDLSRLMATQVGVEGTGFVPIEIPGVIDFPNTIGHYNGWPIPLDPRQRRNGAPPDEYRTPADLYDQLRALNAAIVQFNHPRFPIAEAPLPPIGLGFLTNEKEGFPQPNRGIPALSAGGYTLPLRSSSGAVPSNDGSLDDMNEVRTLQGTRYNDFDTIEIYGGTTALYDLNRIDWYALTSAGYVRTATANSDSHSLSSVQGAPRNYVFAGDPSGGVANISSDLGGLDLATFNETVRPSLVQPTPGTTAPLLAAFFPAVPRTGAQPNSMEVIGTSGPVVYIEIDANEDGTFEGRPGDLVTDDADDSVDVRVTILAAPWVPVDQATILVNGGGAAAAVTGVPAAAPLTGFDFSATDISADLLASATPTPSDRFSMTATGVVRLRQVYSVALPTGSANQDHWIIVEARGAVNAGDPFQSLVPDVDAAIGFTNPVFIDRDADGEWDPNGVP